MPGATRPESPVETFVRTARTWLEAQPDGTTAADLRTDTTVEVDGSAYPLGKRASYYRRRHQGKEGSPLSPNDTATIEAVPGWSWQPRRRGPAPAGHTP